MVGRERSRPVLLKACLNGSREAAEHPALPISPEQVAEDGRRAVASGAAALHVHPRDDRGRETLAPEHCARTLEALRARLPSIPIGVTTGGWIEPDPERRLELIRGWGALPDFASVNFSERGARDLCELLLERGVGVEPGLWSVEDANLLLESGMHERSLRVLVEPGEGDAAAALATAEAIEEVLEDGSVTAPQLHHGTGAAAWPVLAAALKKGHDVRVGLEDTLEGPAGTRAQDNAELVAAAAELVRRSGRVLLRPGRRMKLVHRGNRC